MVQNGENVGGRMLIQWTTRFGEADHRKIEVSPSKYHCCTFANVVPEFVRQVYAGGGGALVDFGPPGRRGPRGDQAV